MPVFFRVRPIAIAVFEIDPEILDWFAAYFFVYSRVNCVREPRRLVVFTHRLRVTLQTVFQAARVIQHIGQLIRQRQTNRARENDEVGRVFCQRRFGYLAQAPSGICPKQMSSAINRVHWLAPALFARVTRHEFAVR